MAHRILVIGVGSIGERHLRCFLATKRAAVSFVDPNESMRRAVAQRYPTARAFDDLDDAIGSGIDAAVIATPAPLHVSLATKLVNAGAHVLIEKPLAVSQDGVEELREAVQAKGLVVAVAYVLRAHPALAAMCDAIRSNAFGRPVQIVAVSGQNFPTYRPAYRQTYYTSHASGGGAVQDALTHVINAGEWLVGPIDRLAADAAHQMLDGVDVEDTVHVITRHANVLGNFSLNQHQAPNESTITVICERGVARFEYHNCRWRSILRPDDPWEDHSFGPLERDELFVRQANSFLDAIEKKREPLCTLDEGIATLRANIAILQSVRQGTWQTLK